MMGLDNPVHLAFLLVILLLVFGAKRLPEMGRSLGAGLRGFKESISGETPSVAELPVAPAVHAGASQPIAEPAPVQPAAAPAPAQAALTPTLAERAPAASDRLSAA